MLMILSLTFHTIYSLDPAWCLQLHGKIASNFRRKHTTAKSTRHRSRGDGTSLLKHCVNSPWISPGLFELHLRRSHLFAVFAFFHQSRAGDLIISVDLQMFKNKFLFFKSSFLPFDDAELLLDPYSGDGSRDPGNSAWHCYRGNT